MPTLLCRGLVFEAMRRAQIGSGNKWLLDAASPGKTRVHCLQILHDSGVTNYNLLCRPSLSS